MKKIVVFICFIIIIVAIIAKIYLNYKMQYNVNKKENMNYEQYYNKEIYGNELATIINKAFDNNNKNNVELDNNKEYISNDKNSVEINIYILDNNTTYKMEKIYNGGIKKFVENYGKIKFKCTKVEYHKDTKRVKSLLFKQITQ